MVHTDIVRIASTQLADSSLYSGTQIIGIVVFYVRGKQIRVVSDSRCFSLESIMVEFAELRSRFGCIGDAEYAIFLVHTLDFLNALVVFQSKGLVHTVFQNESEVFDDGGVVGDGIIIVHSPDFGIDRGDDFHVRHVNHAAPVGGIPNFISIGIVPNFQRTVLQELLLPLILILLNVSVRLSPFTDSESSKRKINVLSCPQRKNLIFSCPQRRVRKE